MRDLNNKIIKISIELNRHFNYFIVFKYANCLQFLLELNNVAIIRPMVKAEAQNV